MTQNFDRWLAERLDHELPDPMTIPAEPSAARYRALRQGRRGLPRFARALMPSVAAQFVLAGATVAVAVAAGAAATGHPPTSFIPAVGGASSATAPPLGVDSGGGGSTTSDHASGQVSSPKNGAQPGPIVKKAVPGRVAVPEPRSEPQPPEERRTPEPSPTAEPIRTDRSVLPAPSPTPEH